MPEEAGKARQIGGGSLGLPYLAPPGGVSVAPGAVVVKASEYTLMGEAEDVLAAARIQAEEIMRRAARDAETERKVGYEAGLAEGKGEVAEQLFSVLAASVEQMASMEEALVDLVLKSLVNVLGTFDDKELVTRVVGHALRLVRDEKRVVLRVSVQDAETVRARVDDFLTRYPSILRIDVAPDAGLGRGGCVMETEAGVIDASLERQLAIIEETLRRHLEERAV